MLPRLKIFIPNEFLSLKVRNVDRIYLHECTYTLEGCIILKTNTSLFIATGVHLAFVNGDFSLLAIIYSDS